MRYLLLTWLIAFELPIAEARAQSLSGEVDLFELHVGQGDEHFVFDSTLEAGGDRHGIAIKAEGGSEVGPKINEVTAQALYTFVPADGTKLFAGVRHDFRGGANLTYASFAVTQDITDLVSAEHFLFVSQDGDVTGAAMAVASLPLARVYSLEPRVSLGWSAQDVPIEEYGSGVTDLELAIRLRREIGSLFNVYIGVIQERLVGKTRDIARANGDRAKVNRAVIGAGLAF